MSRVPAKIRIEGIELRSGGWLARPAGSLGNVGNYPFPWTAVSGTSRENAINKFKHQYEAKINRYEESNNGKDS